MKRFIKKLSLMVAAFAAMLFPVAAPVVVYAQNIESGLCAGAEFDVGQLDNCSPDATGAEDTVNDIIRLVINIFSLVVGVVSVIMIIIGGLKYITSGGESGNVSGAKNTILYAIIGLVVVALAQVIVRFVLSKVEQ